MKRQRKPSEKLQQEMALSTNGAGTVGHPLVRSTPHTALKVDHGLKCKIKTLKLLGSSLAG